MILNEKMNSLSVSKKNKKLQRLKLFFNSQLLKFSNFFINLLPNFYPFSLLKSDKNFYDRQLSEKIFSDVYSQGLLTIDYISFVIVGAVLASVGLATDNSVTVVSSMLVSPLMGPILSVTLGLYLFDKKLLINGFISEIAGVLVVFLISIFCGFGMVYFSSKDIWNWPTFQMADRGKWGSLIVGITIAIPSGVGVGLSITSGDSVNSLVGVAISAALLPPIANSGLSVVFASIAPFIFSIDKFRDEYVNKVSSIVLVNNGNGTFVNKTIITSTLKDGQFRLDNFAIAGYSFALFLLNIVLIFIFTLIVFKLKNVNSFQKGVDDPWKSPYEQEEQDNEKLDKNELKFKKLRFSESKDSDFNDNEGKMNLSHRQTSKLIIETNGLKRVGTNDSLHISLNDSMFNVGSGKELDENDIVIEENVEEMEMETEKSNSEIETKKKNSKEEDEKIRKSRTFDQINEKDNNTLAVPKEIRKSKSLQDIKDE